jgi:hypothetical protein
VPIAAASPAKCGALVVEGCAPPEDLAVWAEVIAAAGKMS